MQSGYKIQMMKNTEETEEIYESDFIDDSELDSVEVAKVQIELD